MKNPLHRSVRMLAIAALAIATFAARSTSAAAPDGPGTKAVRQANDTISGLLKEKAAPGSEAEKKLAAKVTTSVRDFLDVDLLGQRALVDHWKDIPAAKQKELLDTLRALIEDNYVKGLRANLEYTVDYTGETADKDGGALVATIINTKRHGRPYQIHVDYVLVNQGGKLKCYDVKTDGVGLVENYRAQFNKIIAKDGVDGLIAKMKKKRAEGG
jgi:phospholipid transport system substrate-binding protein